jgi:lipid II:glycine glycyltransferase (peptidoglycan interpeptide bridge formation enzyme)
MIEVKGINFNWDNNYTIYSSETYLKSKSNNYGWLGGFIDDELNFVLPYIIKSKYIFRYLIFTSDTIYIKTSTCIEEEVNFLNKVVEYIRNWKIDFINQPETNVLFNCHPINSQYAPFATYIVELDKNEEDLWNNVHQKHRNVIRNAVNNGVEILIGEAEIEKCYQILNTTMRNAGLKFLSREEFIRLSQSVKDNIEIFYSKFKNEIQGCAVYLYSNHSVYYSYGGNISHPILGANNLLHWEAIKHFKNIGVKYYNFVGARINPKPGSKLEGIQRFKKRFGTETHVGYLWKYIYTHWKYKLFITLLKVRNPQYYGDIIDQENNIEK